MIAQSSATDLYRPFNAGLAGFMLGAMALATCFVLSTSAFAEVRHEPSHRVVSLTKQAASGTSATVYRVPSGAELLVKEVCVEHPAVYVEVGRQRDRISFRGSGCTTFSPGYAVTSGRAIRCLNRSGQRRSCTVMGVLDERARVRAGARFYDVDEELAKLVGEAATPGSE